MAAEPRAPHWEDMRRGLAIAAPVPIATLTEALIAAFTHRGEPLPAAALAEAAVLPSHTLVHPGWVVRNLAHADGYVSAAGQEACLTIYGGHAMATGLDRLSDAFRQASVPAAPTAPPIGRRLTVTYGNLSADEVRVAPEASSEQQDGSGQHNDEAAEHAVTTANAPPTAERAESEVEPLEASAWVEAPTVGSPSPAWPRSSLAWLGAVNLSAECRERLPTLRSVPRFLTAGVRRCLTRCLADLQVAMRRRDAPSREAAWKLFLLAPRLLLARCRDTGPVGRATLLRRVELFETGQWEQLLREAHAGAAAAGGRDVSRRADEAVLEEVCERVRQGQLSPARQALTAASLAPGDAHTLQALSDPTRRPPHRRREIPAEVLDHEPAEAVALSVRQVAEALRSAKRGSAPGLSGATVDHYKLLLDDPTALELLAFAANCFARADVPISVIDALSMSRLTALRKPTGGVRGIATGDVFRRLVSRALARAFAHVFDEATRPFQFALSTRAGTDSLAVMLRAATELDPEATIVSLDGRSAYDSVSRAAILGKLKDVAPQLLPFVRSLYARVSTYLWWDDDGCCHEIAQAEGVEQGDSLAPALFARGQHDALVAAAQQLQAGEFLAAFLDDIYVVTTPSQARVRLEAVTSTIERQAGVAANLGKTRVYNAQGGPAPPGISELGADVWCGDKPPSERGFLALGVPIGHEEFVRSCARDRFAEERRLLAQLPLLPDMQCAWLLLLFCAAPRAQHLLRTVPPTAIAEYARAHDDEVWQTLQDMLGGRAGDDEQTQSQARDIAFLPASLGGLGLVHAERLSPAAYWAAWADSLPVLQQRCPEAAQRCLQELQSGSQAAAPSLQAAAAAGIHLDGHGLTERPTWEACLRPAPPQAAPGEPGVWAHGRQRDAALALHTSFRERVLMPAVRPDVRALLRSQAGPHAGAWLAAIPTDPATTLPPDLMHLALRRRMRLPLPLTRARCGGDGAPGCRAIVDNFGDHALACPRTGLLARRGFVLERAWIQVVREAIGPEGRVVPQQWLANTTALGVAADDRRRLDFVIYGAAARRGPLLRCHPGSANQTRWQPSSWSAGARRGRTCHGS